MKQSQKKDAQIKVIERQKFNQQKNKNQVMLSNPTVTLLTTVTLVST